MLSQTSATVVWQLDSLHDSVTACRGRQRCLTSVGLLYVISVPIWSEADWERWCLLLASPVISTVNSSSVYSRFCQCVEFDTDMYKKSTLFSMLHTHSCFCYFLNNMHLAFSPSAVLLYLPEHDFFFCSACWMFFSNWFHFPSRCHSFLPVIPAEIVLVPVLAGSYYNFDSPYTVICLFIFHLWKRGNQSFMRRQGYWCSCQVISESGFMYNMTMKLTHC